jgi:hypothetical protein
MGQVGGSVDDGPGEVGEPVVATAGVLAQEVEGLVGTELEPFGEHPLRLLDDNATGEGGLELFDEQLLLAARTLLQQTDGRHDREGASDTRSRLVPLTGCPAEQVHRPDRFGPTPHRQRVRGRESGALQRGREPGPSPAGDARAVVEVQLERLDQPRIIAGGRA